MDKTITTALMIMAGVICSIFIFNSVYPMLSRSTAAMVSMSDTIDDRMKTRIAIVHAANTSDRKTVYIWVKNVGSSKIITVEESDMFFGLSAAFYRVPEVLYAGGAKPSWSYSLESGTEWLPGYTVKMTITYDVAPDTGIYYIKLVLPNGISDEFYFSM